MSDYKGPVVAESDPATARIRSAVPLVLTLLVLAYELLGKGRLVAPGSLAERLIDVALFLLIGPVMAWWGLSLAKGLVQRLARSEAASEEKSRLLEQRNRQLQTVLQASRAMAAVLDLHAVANLVVEQVVTHTRFHKAALILGPDEHGEYVMAGAHGMPEEHLNRLIDALEGSQKAASPVEWCRLTRQPVVVEHLGRDFRTAGLREVFALAQVESMIAVPLLYQDRFRGTLMVYMEKSGPISTAEISLVSALAVQSALALENARLYTLTAQNRTRLDKAVEFLESVAAALARTRVGVSPLMNLVAQATAKLFAPACIRLTTTRSDRQGPQVVTAVAGVDPKTESEFSRVCGSSSGEGEQGWTPALSLPVTLDGAHFGHFSVYLVGQGRRVDPEEVRILQAFVHLAASALGNAALVAESRRAVEEVERAYMGTLEALIKALELRDHETEGHSRRVVQYSLSLAQKLGVPESQLVPIMRGALLHDIGKIGIPDAILKKPGPLTAEEWVVMKQHARIGYEMLHQIEFLSQATPILLYHHERFDGTGYPEGLSGEAIPLGARIFAVADAYDAITSDRPYRKGRSHQVALDEIKAGAGRQFDARVVKALLALPEEELARIRGRDLESIR